MTGYLSTLSFQLIHYSIWQVCIKFLLCVRNCCRCWEYSNEQEGVQPLLSWSSIKIITKISGCGRYHAKNSKEGDVSVTERQLYIEGQGKKAHFERTVFKPRL